VIDGHRPSVAILADDLIWSTRLASIVDRAGAGAVVVSSTAGFADALEGSAGAIVDLALRSADPIDAIALAALRGTTVVAAGPHEDAATRREALAAGASRVFAYRKLFEDGPRAIARAFGLPAEVPTPGATAGRGSPPAE
jgi:hypothetical protein